MPDEIRNYPSNRLADKDKKTKPDSKKVEKVIAEGVVQRKTPLSRKIADTFTGDDAKSVAGYILFDVVIPAAKSMISDAVSQGIERMLFGDSRRRTTPGLGIGGRTNYTSYSKMYEDPKPGRSMSARAKATHDFGEVVLADRGEAELVLDNLRTLNEDYDVATVNDLYELVGITGSFTDENWGWAGAGALKNAYVERVRDGYLLALPKPTPID